MSTQKPSDRGSKTSILWLLALGNIGAVGTALYVATDSSVPARAPANPTTASPKVQVPARPSSSDIAALRRDLEQLDQQVDELMRTPSASAPPAAPPDPQSAPVPKVEPPSPEVAEHVQAERLKTQYDAHFANETRDTVWAEDIETQVKDLFSSSERLLGSEVHSTDCRQTLCRLTMQSSNVDDKDAALDFISSRPPFTAGGFFRAQPQPDGRVQTVVYFARAGHRMPDVEWAAVNVDE